MIYTCLQRRFRPGAATLGRYESEKRWDRSSGTEGRRQQQRRMQRRLR